MTERKEQPPRWRGVCKSLKGFRVNIDRNPAVDEYHTGVDAEHSIRLMIGIYCLFGIGCRPDYDDGTGAAAFVIINNHSMGLWRDPYATPWASEYGYEEA